MSKIVAFLKAHPLVFKLLAVLLLWAAAFAVGRQSGPVKTVTKTETVEKVVTQIQVQTQIQTKVVTKTLYIHDLAKNIHEVKTTVKKPDGTTTTTLTYDDLSKSDTRDVVQNQATKDVEKTVEKTVEKFVDTKTEKTVDNGKPQWHLGMRLGVGDEFTPGKTSAFLVSAGLGAERRILGPIFMGVWADVHTAAIPFGAAPYTVLGGLSLSFEL